MRSYPPLNVVFKHLLVRSGTAVFSNSVSDYLFALRLIHTPVLFPQTHFWCEYLLVCCSSWLTCSIDTSSPPRNIFKTTGAYLALCADRQDKSGQLSPVPHGMLAAVQFLSTDCTWGVQGVVPSCVQYQWWWWQQGCSHYGHDDCNAVVTNWWRGVSQQMKGLWLKQTAPQCSRQWRFVLSCYPHWQQPNSHWSLPADSCSGRFHVHQSNNWQMKANTRQEVTEAPCRVLDSSDDKEGLSGACAWQHLLY